MPKKPAMNGENAIKEWHQECLDPRRAPPLRWSRSATLRYRHTAERLFVGREAPPFDTAEHDASRDHRNMTLEIHTQHRVTASRGSSPSGSSHLDDRGKVRPPDDQVEEHRSLDARRARPPFPLEPPTYEYNFHPSGPPTPKIAVFGPISWKLYSYRADTQHRVTTSRGSSPSGSSHLDDRSWESPRRGDHRQAGTATFTCGVSTRGWMGTSAGPCAEVGSSRFMVTVTF